MPGILRRVLRRRAGITVETREPESQRILGSPDAPAIVVQCPTCGYDYRYTRLAFRDGSRAMLWMCACGATYFPPGGKDSAEWVRP